MTQTNTTRPRSTTGARRPEMPSPSASHIDLAARQVLPDHRLATVAVPLDLSDDFGRVHVLDIPSGFKEASDGIADDPVPGSLTRRAEGPETVREPGVARGPHPAGLGHTAPPVRGPPRGDRGGPAVRRPPARGPPRPGVAVDVEPSALIVRPAAGPEITAALEWAAPASTRATIPGASR